MLFQPSKQENPGMCLKALFQTFLSASHSLVQDNVLKYHCRAAFEPDFFSPKYSKQTNFKTKKIQTTQDGMSNGLFVVGTPCQGLNY